MSILTVQHLEKHFIVYHRLLRQRKDNAAALP